VNKTQDTKKAHAAALRDHREAFGNQTRDHEEAYVTVPMPPSTSHSAVD